MPEVIMIGSAIIQTKLPVLIVSFIVAYYVVKWKLVRLQIPEPVRNQLLDKCINATIIGLIVWKFTPVIKEPSLLWTNLRGVLVYTGGTLGLTLGVILGLLYILITLWRAGILTPLLFDVLAYGLLITWLVYRGVFWEYGTLTDVPWGISLNDPQLKYHPVNLYAALTALVIAVILWFSHRKRWGTSTIARDALAGLGLGWLAVSFFQRTKVEHLLTAEQWIWVSFIIAGLAMPLLGRLMFRIGSAGEPSSLIQTTPIEHTKDGKEMMEVVKETSRNMSPEQRKQTRENQDKREFKPEQMVDKKLDGPNRPAE